MPSKALITLYIILLPIVLFAQKNNFWEMTDVNDIKKEGVIEYSASVEHPIYFKLDKDSMSAFVSNAPDRYEASRSTILLAVPNPEGEIDTFEVFSTQTMSKGLAESLPNVKSYVGRNVSNKSHALRITITPQGFFGMTVGSIYGQTFINPFAKNTNAYMVFSKKDATSNNIQAFRCEVVENNTTNGPIASIATPKFIDGGILRRYLIGVATTVEYSEFHWLAAGLTAGDTNPDKKDAVQAAIVVSIDRVNQIYERDLGVTLELIPNNLDVIYLGNPNSDPYTNDSGATMLGENQTVFNNVIGGGNYDIGHVFSTGGGGIASTPSVCNPFAKARGVTGQANPVGDFFDIDFVAHEVGHQFGAKHTQNNNCNRNAATAMEPGSANTIMGYAGICAPNVQTNSDAMFHYISILEISDYFVSTSNNTGNCADEITIVNAEPVVQAVPDYVIPQNTPFLLQADATDANGDVLTYSWEQLDNEVVVMPPQSTSTGGPSFRTFLPTTSPIRYFPAMSTLLTNSYSSTWEVLPTVSRTLDFGVIVRDNNMLGGQVSSATTTLTVNDAAGPFRVTSQNATGDAWIANSTKTVTWDVANTDDVAGVNTQNVDILLSIDGGETYSTVLLTNTPNDGSQDITVPNVVATSARIMVKASNNIFFDINSQAFSIGVEFIPTYCDAGAANPSFPNISRVVFNTIDNTSLTANTGYRDYKNIDTPISRGQTYSLSTFESGDTLYTGDQVIVWIDYNKNGIFTDPGEKVIETASFQGDFIIYPFGGNITVPASASLGKTTMRVRLNNSNFGTSNTTPCGNSTYGEVEDYTVVIYDDYVYYDNTWTPTNPSGVSTAADNVLVVNGSPTLTGTTISNTLSILPFKTLNIEGVLDVNGDIDNDGYLIFKSNATSTGQLDTFTGTISGSGTATVERFIPAGDNNKRAFRMVTSTVSTSNSIQMNWQEGVNNTSTTNLNPNPGYGTHISGSLSGANGFDVTGSGNPSLFTYDPTGQTWGAIANTDVNPLEAGSPYRLMVRGDRSIDLSSNTSTPTNTILRATGDLKIGSVNVSSTMALGADEFSFIGNPYQAVVDYGSLTTSNLTDFIYVWDASIAGATGRGGYVTVEVSSNSIVPSPSSSDATKYIAPGQAFFVQNTAAGNGSITFEEVDKATAQSQVSIFNTHTDFYINSRLYKSIDLQNALMESDAIGLRFSNNFTTLGSDEDATKLYNLDENYAISNNGHKSIDQQDLPIDGHIVELYTTDYTTTNYSFIFDLGNQPQDLRVRLYDNYLNTQTELVTNTLYDFTVDTNVLESIATNRFSLHFDYTTLGIGDNNFGEDFSLYPNPTNTGQFTINATGLAGQFVTIKIYNMLGQDVFTNNSTVAPNDEINVNASSLSNGLYMVELDQSSRKIRTKLLIK
jgi:hypothetical protein